MNQYKLTLFQAIKIHSTNKDFILFDIDNDSYIVSYKLTNDLLRYKKKYKYFKTIENIKQQTKLLTFY